MENIDTASLPPPPLLPGAVVASSHDAVKAAVLIQAFARRKMVYRRLAKHKQRASVIRELALTENKYMVSLRISTADYLHPLIGKCSTSEEVLSADKIRRIFGSIEMVEILSKKLLVEFTKRAARLNYWTRVGEVFLSLEKSMQCYAEYVKCYDAARAALGEALDNPKCSLNAFDQAVQKKHGIKLGIRDFLIMPVQRVPRYILLLKDILKQTEPSHPDYEDVKLAMAKLQEFTVHMDAEAQRSETLRIIESKLSGDVKMLHAGPADRRFLHEGSLYEESKQRKVYLFLFSDMMIVAKEQDGKGSSLTLRRAPTASDGKLQVIESMPLSELSRCTNIKSFSNEPIFQFKLDGATYTCSSDEERQIWITHIHRLLRALRSKAQKRMTMQMTPEALLAASPTTRAAAAASVSSGVRKPKSKSRWGATPSAPSSSTEFEGLLARPSVSSDSSISPKPTRVSGSAISLGSRNRRAASAVSDEPVVQTNPLMTMKTRHRSQSSIVKTTETAQEPPVSAALPPPAVTVGGVAAVQVDQLPPPPLLPSAVRTSGSSEASKERAEVLYAFKASSAKEMDVEAGQIVSVVKTLPSGWSVVLREDGTQGVVPRSYLKRMNE